ncbi:hypothetical protein AHAS_Ahas16G0190600 [Arachis hypogaea]
MMHVCPMQDMSSCVGLHPTARHYLGTIGAKLDPIIYTQGETMILSLWASPISIHKQNNDPQFVGFPEINIQQQTRSSVRGLYPRSILNNTVIFSSWVIPKINTQQYSNLQFVGYT